MKSIKYISIVLIVLGLSVTVNDTQTRDSSLLSPNQVEAVVNEQRVEHKLLPLRSSEILRESACLKANDMAEKGYFAHIAPDGTEPWVLFKKAGYKYDTAGENLARSFKDAPSTVRGWMNSKTHRELILSDYEEQGICSVGKYTVQHFGTRK